MKILICAIFGHKVAKKMLIAYDPAFGAITRNECRCGMVTFKN